MSLPVRIMDLEGGIATVDDGRGNMSDHNGVLMMQRLLLAGTLGLSLAQKAAAILDGEPASGDGAGDGGADPLLPVPAVLDGQQAPDPRSQDGAVLRAILDAANECLGHFDDRPPGERWCDALLHLLDLAAFAADLGAAVPAT
jgi:hypothetical protein